MINLVIEKIVFIIKIIDLNIMIFTKKIIIALIFEINSKNIYIKKVLINQNTIILFYIIILELKIWYFETIIFLLIYYFMDIIIKDKYP